MRVLILCPMCRASLSPYLVGWANVVHIDSAGSDTHTDEQLGEQERGTTDMSLHTPSDVLPNRYHTYFHSNAKGWLHGSQGWLRCAKG